MKGGHGNKIVLSDVQSKSPRNEKLRKKARRSQATSQIRYRGYRRTDFCPKGTRTSGKYRVQRVHANSVVKPRERLGVLVLSKELQDRIR